MAGKCVNTSSIRIDVKKYKWYKLNKNYKINVKIKEGQR